MKKIAYKKVEQIEKMKINNLIRCMKILFSADER